MSDLSGRRIVLIGGAGFIGHNLAIRLSALGAEVTILDALAVNNYYSLLEKKDPSPNWGFYLGVIEERLRLLKDHEVPLREVDSRDYHLLSRVLAELRPHAVIHLAAVAHAGRSNKDPYSTFNHSLLTLENALDYARSSAVGVEHFIFFSSSMVYGHFQGGEVLEDTRCNPLGIYGALKFAGEKLVIAYGQVFDLPYTIIRPSALYGRRCISRRVGQIFIENALAGNEVTVHGDGSDRLDFTYIDDLVEGVVGTLTHEKAKGEIFNLTYGKSRPLVDLVDILQETFPNLKVNYLPKDKLTPDRGTLNVDKARRLIGYQPKNPIEVGFRKYIEWYRESWERISHDRESSSRPVVERPQPAGDHFSPDTWLSGQLGIPCYRVTVDEAAVASAQSGGPLAEAIRTEINGLAGFQYAKVPSGELATVHFLEDLGFHLADTAVLLEREVRSDPEVPDGIGPATPEDRPGIERVARESFRFSRFHADPGFSAAAADSLKAEWAGNFFEGARGDAMAVARVDGEVAGFLQLLIRENGDLVIDLVATHPDHQRAGLAAGLISFCEREHGKKGARILVGTQAANIPSLRLYEKLGFRMSSCQYILHRHAGEA